MVKYNHKGLNYYKTRCYHNLLNMREFIDGIVNNI